MASTRPHSIGPELSATAVTAGLFYLPVYVILLSLGIDWLAEVLKLELTALQVNVCWFVLNGIFVWIIFHRFLLGSFRNIRFWDLVQAVILGFALYYAGNFLISLMMNWLKLDIPRYNDETVETLMGENSAVMIACGVILAPMIEETLARGLIFGTLRRKSRILAYGVSMVFFAAIHVWQYLPREGWEAVALAAVPYLPAGIALGWTYEKGSNVWAPIALHAAINAISFGLLIKS